MRNSRLLNAPWKLIIWLILEAAFFITAFYFADKVFSSNAAIFEPLSYGIVIFFLIVGGITIALYGAGTKNRKWSYIGYIIFLVIVFVTIDRYKGLDSKISAISAILVAFAAFIAIEENRQLRYEERQQKEKEKKERLLTTITTWGIDIAKCESELQIPVLPVPQLSGLEAKVIIQTIEHTNAVSSANLAMRYQSLDAKSKYIKSVAKRYDESYSGDLLPLVVETADKLATNIEMLFKQIKGDASLQDRKKQWESLVNNALTLVEKADQLVE